MRLQRSRIKSFCLLWSTVRNLGWESLRIWQADFAGVSVGPLKDCRRECRPFKGLPAWVSVLCKKCRLECRAFARTAYTGLHSNAGVYSYTQGRTAAAMICKLSYWMLYLSLLSTQYNLESAFGSACLNQHRDTVFRVLDSMEQYTSTWQVLKVQSWPCCRVSCDVSQGSFPEQY